MNALLFRETVFDMDEHEVLTHLLSFTRRNNDSGTLAHNLLDSFGSLKNVMEARPEQLKSVPGIGEKTAEFVASLIGIVRSWQRAQLVDYSRIGNSHEAGKYCLQLLAGLRHEEFWLICLNAQCKVLGKRKISTGSLSEVSAYPRMIVETALNYNAHSVLFTHNHPGGTLKPSTEDIASTIQVQKLLSGIGILVLDHIIVSGDATYSMIQHGDINYHTR